MIGYTTQGILVIEEGAYTVETIIDGCASDRSLPKVFITTSVDELLDQINVYPNPAVGILYVEIPDMIAGNVHAELFDITGNLLESRDISTPGISIFDLKEIQGGISVLKIIHEGKTTVRKIITY